MVCCGCCCRGVGYAAAAAAAAAGWSAAAAGAAAAAAAAALGAADAQMLGVLQLLGGPAHRAQGGVEPRGGGGVHKIDLINYLRFLRCVHPVT